MREAGRLTVLALPGRGQDERVWGGLVPRLRREHDVVLLDSGTDVRDRAGDVILVSSDGVSGAVLGVRDRALVLLGPVPDAKLPEVSFEPGSGMEDARGYMQLGAELSAARDPQQRRSLLADGMLKIVGRELPSADRERLRGMIFDLADVVLDPAAARAPRLRPYAEDLMDVSAPVLIVAAGRDHRTAITAQALAARAPRGELVLLDTSQTAYPWLAQPDTAAQAVLDFLARV